MIDSAVYDFLIHMLPLQWLPSFALLLVGLVAGLLVYGCLADLTWFEDRGRLRGLRFGRADLAIGSMLTGLLILLAVMGFRAAAHAKGTPVLPGPTEMIEETVVSATMFLIVIAGILASLTARGIPWRDCFGLTRLGLTSVVARALALVALALPLITVALAVGRMLLAGAGDVNDSPQDIVMFLERNSTATARWIVAVFAIVVAPMQEEFLFRGYLYGIMRRYAGPAVGTVLNATLFAAIHIHLPSFSGLFVLAMCLTLAYEWSGSLFVPMLMHALFNSLTVVELLGGTLGR